MLNQALVIMARSHKFAVNFIRVAIFIVMAWIGALKVVPYEAVGIVPFVANSPFMGFLYTKPVPEYKDYKNPEGALVPKNVEWHKENGTYLFSYGLGAVICIFGAFVLSGIWSPEGGLIGGILTVIMAFVTLTFLITTPETWVQPLGDAHHGFPYLSGAGRLVIKDIIMMGGGFICITDCAQRLLAKRNVGQRLSS